MLDTHGRKFVNPIINRTAKILIKYKFSANSITIIGFMIGVMTGVFIYLGFPFAAIILLWISGYLDAVDGAVARVSKTSTPWGTLMDITFDRLVEISIVVGLAMKFPEIRLELVILTAAIIFSMTVFLTVGALSDKKAMKSFYYQAGLAERTEGFILFTLIILLPRWNHIITLVFAIMIIVTGIQRMLEARKLFLRI